LIQVSVVINTYNEEHNLPYALRSVHSWAHEIIVVDMHSTDKTVQIAEQYGAKVFYHDQTGYVEAARAYAVAQASHEWVLLLDADEVVPKTLSEALLELAQHDRADVVYIPYCNYFLGQYLKGTFIRLGNDTHARFFKRSHLLLKSRIHQYVQPAPGARRLVLAHQEALAIHHFSYASLSSFAQKIDRYTTVEANQALERGEKSSIVRALWDAVTEFLSQYIKHQGFRAGWRGFYYSAYMAHYYIAKWGKLKSLYAAGNPEQIRQGYDDVAESLLKNYP
jgi:(heptosyl)LPS beta-1,4-glucosyltransferase